MSLFAGFRFLYLSRTVKKENKNNEQKATSKVSSVLSLIDVLSQRSDTLFFGKYSGEDPVNLNIALNKN